MPNQSIESSAMNKIDLELELEDLKKRIETLEIDLIMHRTLITGLMKQIKEITIVQKTIAAQLLAMSQAFAHLTEASIDYEYLSYEDDGTYN